MPVFASYTDLRKWGAEDKAQRLLKEASLESFSGSRPNEKSVFLSHSTKDDDLVGGVALILQNHGGNVYIDHSDPSISEDNCLAIAAHLRVVIHGCRKFVMLASPRSKDSTWMPWELGLGDGIHSPVNVAIFPSAETIVDMKWSEREYLGLYRRIVWGTQEGQNGFMWLVWDFRTNTAEKLSNWLAS